MANVHLAYVDSRAQGEFWRLALASFLISFVNAQATLFSIIFGHSGFGLSDVGLLLSAVAPPIVVFALGSAEISARIGALWTLRIAMGFCVMGFASLYFTRLSFAAAYGSRVVHGVGLGLLLASLMTYGQSLLTPKNFVFLLGVLSATLPLAQAVAPAFGEAFIGRFGEQELFLWGSLPGLVGLLITFTLRPLARPSRSHGYSLLKSWRWSMLEPCLAVLLNGAIFGYAMAYFAPDFMARKIPLAAFFTCSSVAMFGSRFLALRGIDRLNKRAPVAMGFLCMACGFLIIAFAGSVIAIVALGAMVFGFGYSLTYPVLSAWVSEGMAPAQRAGPQAWLSGFFNFGLFATPLPAIFLVSASSYKTVMVLLAGLAIIFALVLLAQWLCGE